MPIHFEGKLLRAINPRHARDPLSGRSAELYGGRFNRKGTPALYCSLAVATALREANQVGKLQPMTLVAYDADVDGVFDTRDETALLAAGMDRTALADASWRDRTRHGGEASTRVFAHRLIAEGYRGVLVRSFARGAAASDLNLVLWQWGSVPPARLILIDDEGRLSG